MAGHDFSISFPSSSQSMLKSARIFLALLTRMLGATTRRWIPPKNIATKHRHDNENNGWDQRDSMKVTVAVLGSLSQCHAPTATQTDTTTSTTLQRNAVGWLWEITSVKRRSNAFKSSQAIFLRDIFTVEEISYHVRTTLAWSWLGFSLWYFWR